MKKVPVTIIALLLIALLVVLLWWHPAPQTKHTVLEGGGKPHGGDFVLQSAHGPVALRDLRGKVVLLYFGYTFCPDVCPTSLALMGQALRELKPEELRQVQGIFVSVDPARDTLDRLVTYAGYFHPNIVGVTGTAEQVANVAKLYGVVYHKVEDSSSPEYVVNHSSFTTVIDQGGQIYKVLPHGAAPDQIAAVIRELLRAH